MHRAFTSKALSGHRDLIDRTVSTVVGEAIARGAVDAVRDLADLVAAGNLAGVLGLPAGQESTLLAGFTAVFESLGSFDPPTTSVFEDPRTSPSASWATRPWRAGGAVRLAAVLRAT